jgi:hypothetical protein
MAGMIKTSLVLPCLVLALVLIACVDKKPAPAQVDAAPTVASAAVTPVSASGSAKPRFTVTACEALVLEGESKLARERAGSEKACTKDDECTLVLSGVCAPACTDYAMTKTASALYAKKRTQIDREICQGWRDNDCASISPKPPSDCAPMHAVCKDKQCTAVPNTK